MLKVFEQYRFESPIVTDPEIEEWIFIVFSYFLNLQWDL